MIELTVREKAFVLTALRAHIQALSLEDTTFGIGISITHKLKLDDQLVAEYMHLEASRG